MQIDHLNDLSLFVPHLTTFTLAAWFLNAGLITLSIYKTLNFLKESSNNKLMIDPSFVNQLFRYDIFNGLLEMVTIMNGQQSLD